MASVLALARPRKALPVAAPLPFRTPGLFQAYLNKPIPYLIAQLAECGFEYSLEELTEAGTVEWLRVDTDRCGVLSLANASHVVHEVARQTRRSANICAQEIIEYLPWCPQCQQHHPCTLNHEADDAIVSFTDLILCLNLQTHRFDGEETAAEALLERVSRCLSRDHGANVVTRGPIFSNLCRFQGSPQNLQRLALTGRYAGSLKYMHLIEAGAMQEVSEDGDVNLLVIWLFKLYDRTVIIKSELVRWGAVREALLSETRALLLEELDEEVADDDLKNVMCHAVANSSKHSEQMPRVRPVEPVDAEVDAKVDAAIQDLQDLSTSGVGDAETPVFWFFMFHRFEKALSEFEPVVNHEPMKPWDPETMKP